MNAPNQATIFIAPAAPLVLRSGKAFGTVGAPGGDTLPFPLPGTLAGALRGAYGDQCKVDFMKDTDAVNKLKKIHVKGPFFAKIGADGKLSYLLPRPLDAAYLQSHEKHEQLKQLSPSVLRKEEEYADVPDDLDLLFLPPDLAKSKPADGPAFWDWKKFSLWLSAPAKMLSEHLNQLGDGAPPVEVSTHVVVETSTQHALDQGLFQSAGADFGPRRNSELEPRQISDGGWKPGRYGLVAEFPRPFAPGFIKFGGEGRLSRVDAAITPLPAYDDKDTLQTALRAALKGKKKLRMILATPGLFDDGWKPAWLKNGGLPDFKKFQLTLKAAAIDRAQPVSGWDMTQGAGGAKPARRMAPAGSVYWLEIGNLDAKLDAAALAEKLWLMPLSDNANDRRDGYGLALFGVWD